MEPCGTVSGTCIVPSGPPEPSLWLYQYYSCWKQKSWQEGMFPCTNLNTSSTKSTTYTQLVHRVTLDNKCDVPTHICFYDMPGVTDKAVRARAETTAAVCSVFVVVIHLDEWALDLTNVNTLKLVPPEFPKEHVLLCLT